MPKQNRNIPFPGDGIDSRPPLAPAAGFTLLEVMIAVAIIAIAFVSLLGSQSGSVAIATEARFRTEAAMLASRKLAEISVADPAELSSGEGDFEEEFSHYHWKVEVSELGEEETGIKDLAHGLRLVEIAVSRTDDDTAQYLVRTIVMDRIE